MRPTRLQLLLLFIALGVSGYCGYVWWQGRAPLPTSTPPAAPPETVSPALLTPKPAPAAPVSPPPAVAQKQSAQAPIAPSADGAYTVVKGDTLWHIAATRSPVHQGPGWVTIWKVNKTTVKDFDRLEVGWNLTIPSTPQEYVMPYWKPRDLARAQRPSTSYVVDLRQLPSASESVLVDLRQLPATPESVLVDLKQLPDATAGLLVDLKQLPTGEEFALAAVPKDFHVDLQQLPPAEEMALAEAIPDDFTASAFRRPVEENLGQPSYRYPSLIHP